VVPTVPQNGLPLPPARSSWKQGADHGLVRAAERAQHAAFDLRDLFAVDVTASSRA
jgi:hypothetical protein